MAALLAFSLCRSFQQAAPFILPNLIAIFKLSACERLTIRPDDIQFWMVDSGSFNSLATSSLDIPDWYNLFALSTTACACPIFSPVIRDLFFDPSNLRLLRLPNGEHARQYFRPDSSLRSPLIITLRLISLPHFLQVFMILHSIHQNRLGLAIP